MNELLFLATPLAAGGLLGAIFFGGLWLTVARGVSSPNPAALFFASLVLRMTVALTGFYFIGRQHWQHWLLCLLGFVLARLAVGRLTLARADDRDTHPPETSYAPQSR